MLARALAFPFVLLRRKPATVTVCLIAGIALVVAVDLIFTRAGLFASFDPDAPLAYGVSLSFYYLARALISAAPSTILLAASLRMLDLRALNRVTRLAECGRIAILSFVYAIVFVAPFSMGESLARARLGDLGLSITAAFWISAIGFAIAQALALFSLSFAWPHTLATGRFILLRAFALNTKRFSAVLAVLAPALVLQMAVSWSGQIGSSYAAMLPQTEAGLFSPWLVGVISVETARVIASFLFSATNVFLYAQLDPHPATQAQVFS